MSLISPRPTPAALSAYPVPIELITSLYRATQDQFEAMLARMPENGRARVAAYCTESDRLVPLGLRIARTCEAPALIRVAGEAAGADLFAQSRAVEPSEH